MKQKWLVVVASDGENTTEPELIKADTFADKQRKADESTGGNWSYGIVSEFEA